MIHAEAQSLLAAGAVLDDLAPDERAAYDEHRGVCLDCRRLELELDHVLADLALVVPERLPPPDLLGDIRRALASEAGAVAADGTGPLATPRPLPAPAVVAARGAEAARPRPDRRLAAVLGLAAVLAIAALGLGARSVTLQRDLDATQARVAALEGALAQRADAMTVALDPGHVTVALHAEPLAPAADAAVVYVPGSATAFLVARALPATPAGRTYQLWYADDAGVHPLQTATFDGVGTFVAPIDADLAQSAAVMITLEPAGGATGEPGPQVVFGEL